MRDEKIFIVDPANTGWIIEKLMNDIREELESKNFTVRVGAPGDYNGESIIFNSRYLDIFTNAKAKINSVFLTHVDDRLKENEVLNTSKNINSIICMSEAEGRIFRKLLENRRDIVIHGIDLPPRSTYVNPYKIGIFSSCYGDGRKNEDWLLEYFGSRNSNVASAFILKLLGQGWSKIATDLEALDVSFEIIRYSTSMPNEYSAYKARLEDLHRMIYMGFDGGAMSIYDAISSNTQFIYPNLSYHKNLDPSSVLFDRKGDFFALLDSLCAERDAKIASLCDRSIERYVANLLSHWSYILNKSTALHDDNMASSDIEMQDLETYRSHYKKISSRRLLSYILRFKNRFFH
jgi:hypothetical protein